MYKQSLNNRLDSLELEFLIFNSIPLVLCFFLMDSFRLLYGTHVNLYIRNEYLKKLIPIYSKYEIKEEKRERAIVFYYSIEIIKKKRNNNNNTNHKNE